MNNNPATPQVNPGLVDCNPTTSAKFDALTYNASLDWKVDADTLLHVAARSGYRSGGFSARATTEEGLRRPYQLGFVNDFELGAKKDWKFANGAFLRTNLALFNRNYTDIKRYVTDLYGRGHGVLYRQRGRGHRAGGPSSSGCSDHPPGSNCLSLIRTWTPSLTSSSARDETTRVSRWRARRATPSA